ncbi:Ribosomal RNA small subunit methyltransferase H [Candidatus Entotheonellaceae bacterium PAL068K]
MTGMVPPVQHDAVMQREVLSRLLPDTPGVYVDCTLGAGGHVRAFLQARPTPCMVIGIDRDPACIAAARQWGHAWRHTFRPMHGDFRHLTQMLMACGYTEVDSILFDLGVSSYQLDTARRGFSFRLDGPLDMRMDTRQEDTACTLVNQASAAHLCDIIRTLGEERWAKRIAQAIVAERRRAPLTRTRHLADLVARTIPRAAWPRHIHPATRVFQALRMAVNDELQALIEGLPQAVAALRLGGRFGVIAFHSLDDRQVKQFLAQEAKGCTCPPRLPQCLCGRQPRLRVLTRKPLVPSPQEVRRNPRSRSARLRIAEKIEV